MLEEIRESVLKYQTFYKGLKDNAKEIRESLLANKYSLFEESQNIQKITKDNNVTVCAVDSGFFSDSFTGLDFAYVKTAGSYFNYQNGKLTNYKRDIRYRDKNIYFSDYPLQKDEIHKFVSIKRIRDELKSLKNIVKDYTPELLLIDGPVLPQPVDRPLNNSKLYHDYKGMIVNFVELYDICKSQDTKLVGCVEDSRAASFLDLIKEKNDRINDTLFLDLVLNKGEALSFFKIFSTDSNIINQDLEEFGKFEFFASYLKPNEDYPLRIETLSKDFSNIRNKICFLAGHFKEYAFPTPLIDADKQAKLNNKEVETIRTLIEKEFIKFKIKKLRRNRRV